VSRVKAPYLKARVSLTCTFQPLGLREVI